MDGGFFDIVAHAQNVPALLSTYCHLDLFYGIDGNTPTTSLGQLVAQEAWQNGGEGIKTFLMGSPYGLSARSIQLRFRLEDMTIGSSPIFRDAVTHYLKDPDKRESFDFTIDLNKTARERGNSLESLYGTLDAIRDKKTLVPFWYGHIGTKSVKVLDIPSNEKVDNDQIFGGERDGMIKIRVSEII
jgi:hypothetical protein